MDKSRSSHRVRGALATLPDRKPARVWGGSGSGTVCALCGQPVTAQQPELELEFAGDPSGGLTCYHVHVLCFSLWESERKVLLGASDHGTIADRGRTRSQTGEPEWPGTQDPG